MPQVLIEKRVIKFLEKLPPKQKNQLSRRIIELSNTPKPHDCSALIGYPDYYRITCGEYRIIYRYNNEKVTLNIILIGKRNDDDAYHQLRNLLG